MIVNGLINHMPVCRVCLSCPCNLSRYPVLSFSPVILSYSSVSSDFPVPLSILYALCTYSVCAVSCPSVVFVLRIHLSCPTFLYSLSFLPNCSKIIANLVLNQQYFAKLSDICTNISNIFAKLSDILANISNIFAKLSDSLANISNISAKASNIILSLIRVSLLPRMSVYHGSLSSWFVFLRLFRPVCLSFEYSRQG